MTTLRVLTDQGTTEFRAYLRRVREGAAEPPPFELLNSPGGSAELPVVIWIEQAHLATKQAAAEYLNALLKPLDPRQVIRNAGLWSWLALFFFDQLAPPNRDGSRKLLKENLYAYSENPRLEYRHLLYGPYRVHQLHGENARFLFNKPVSVWSDLEEQLGGVQEIIRAPQGLSVVANLYYDPAQDRAKRGVTNRKKPGTVRRLRTVIQQLDLTYDLYSMKAEEILGLLPPEFDRFKES